MVGKEKDFAALDPANMLKNVLLVKMNPEFSSKNEPQHFQQGTPLITLLNAPIK